MAVFASRIAIASVAAFALLAGSGSAALAQKKYDTGATDTEIKIGNIMPYSGPASAYGVIGRTETAYFKKINDAGGINGRKINFISYDDSYSPPKAVEQARKLVESDEVLLVFNSLGTPSNSAIQKYMNAKKVPQLFVATGATKWNDPKDFPWTMGWQPSYQSEGRIYAKYILKEKPNAKIAVLYQNDDYGKDYLKGLKDGLGNKAASMIIAEESFETSEPTIDNHIVKLKATGADIFVDIATPKFAAQAIKKAASMGWKPLIILPSVSNSFSAVLEPAGIENAVGVVTGLYLKDPNDVRWADDPALKDWLAWMKKYQPNASTGDLFNVQGYTVAQIMVRVLQNCKDDLSRENIIKQATALDGLAMPMLLPGIKVHTDPHNVTPIRQIQMARFDGRSWVLFGDVLGEK